MLTPAELRKKDMKFLQEELEKARSKKLALKMSLTMNQSKKWDEMNKNKIYVAQILTVMNEMSRVETEKKEEKSEKAAA